MSSGAIRKALKREFPGVKFNVRSDTDVIGIEWTDGPTAKAVEAVVKRSRARPETVTFSRFFSPELIAKAREDDQPYTWLADHDERCDE